MFVVPGLVAAVLRWREGGAQAAAALFARTLGGWRVKHTAWFVVAVLFMPAVAAARYAAIGASGAVLAAPEIPVATAGVFAMFFAAAVFEEAGWQAYALPAMQARWSALESALWLGVVWAAWHVIPYLQMGHDWAWVFWQCAFSVAARVVMVWLTNNTEQSVLVAVLFHAMINVSAFVFGDMGMGYDPFAAFCFTGAGAALAVSLWGPATLSRFRFARG